MASEDHWDADRAYERDQEREIDNRTRRRAVLNPRGTLRQHFEPDAPPVTVEAFEKLRREGLL